MRFPVFLTGIIFFGIFSAAYGGVGLQSYVAERVEADLIITTSSDRVSIYGVRLIGEGQDPELYQKAQQYLQRSFDQPTFTLDTRAFQKSGSIQNRYGDLHGKILLKDGRWLQEQLIAQGYGVWSGAPDYPSSLRQLLIQAEATAAKEKLGLWRQFRIINANQPPQTFWNGQFIIVKGVVRDVFRGSGATYLNFGDDWRSDFTVAIPSRSRKNFKREVWTIASLKNKSVTVRGLVRFYNGPYLELDFPEQLEVSNVVGEG